MHDVKIRGGNNRQFDLLAVSLVDGSQYHVESSVTHTERWAAETKDLAERFDKKFLGEPAKRSGPHSDAMRGKDYKSQIFKAYQSVGMDPTKIKRIWVTWFIKDTENISAFLKKYRKEKGIEVEIISLRDQIIPELQYAVSTSNYDDEVLRTLSLLKQRERGFGEKTSGSGLRN